MSRRRAAPATGVADLARAWLAEDIGDGDRTSEWTIDPATRGTARIVARAAGVVAGVELADATLAAADPDLERVWRVADGDAVDPGDELVRIVGSLRSILAAERVTLNGLSHLSGVATLAARYARALRDSDARLLDTRKTTPGWRRLEKAAAVAGGAVNHRMGLDDMVLIKENHIRGAGGIGRALAAAIPRARAEGLEVEIEVTDVDELLEALPHGPDRILLDNMAPRELEEAVRRVRATPGPHPLLEASGGVTLDTLRAVAATGVDFVSVGAITHSAPALDLALEVDR